MNVLVLLERSSLVSADRAALAVAAALAGDGSVVVVGSSHATEALRSALDHGATRVIEVTDPSLVDGDPTSVGRIFADLGRRFEASVLVASAAGDTDGLGLVPAAAAEALGAPYIAGVLEATPALPGLLVTASASGGRLRLRTSLPAVLIVASSAPVPAAPSSRSGAALEETTLEALGLAAAALPRGPDLRGDLEHPKRKAKIVGSLDELLRLWRA